MAVDNPENRNRLQTIIMQLSDRVCEKHLGDISANASFVNLGFGGLTALFAGTGTVVGGEVAKSALAAAASIMGTGRALVNEEVYQERLASGIVKAIREDRDNQDQEIKARRWDPATNDIASLAVYSVDAAIRDALIYHYSCSFYHGVELLADAAGLIGLRPAEISERMKKIRDEINATRKMQNETQNVVEKKLHQMTIDTLSQQNNTLALRLLTTKFK